MDSAQAAHHDIGLDQDAVLHRCLAGLTQADLGLESRELNWITVRLAELLGWPLPAWLPVPESSPRR